MSDGIFSLIFNNLMNFSNGSVALLSHFTSSEVRYLDLIFLRGAGRPGNPCAPGQPAPCRKTKSKNRTLLEVKCENKTTLPILMFISQNIPH